jgi:hypothetical protein
MSSLFGGSYRHVTRAPWFLALNAMFAGLLAAAWVSPVDQFLPAWLSLIVRVAPFVVLPLVAFRRSAAAHRLLRSVDVVLATAMFSTVAITLFGRGVLPAISAIWVLASATTGALAAIVYRSTGVPPSRP